MKQLQLPLSIKSIAKKWWTPWAVGYLFVVGAALFATYYWRSIFMLGNVLPPLLTSLQVLGGFSIVYLLFFCIYRFCGDKLCVKAALCVLVLGLLFVFATAPLQVPDELGHYLRAHSISQGNFNYDYAREYPADVSHFSSSFSALSAHKIKFGEGQLAPAHFAEYFQNIASGAVPTTPVGEGYNLNIVPYLPAALGMAVARLFGFKALGLMYAARIANLLCYAFIAYFTFKNCDKYRGVFFAVALLPLSVFMAASCSSDGIILALSFYAVSFFCKNEIRTKDVFLFLLAVLAAAYLKPPNILLMGIILLVPTSRWKNKINPWLILLGGVVAFVALYFGFEAINTLLKTNFPPTDPRGSGAASPQDQLVFVLQYPFRFLSTLVLTFFEHQGFLFDLGTLGLVDLTLPLVSGLSVLSLSAASALGIQQKEDTKIGGAAALALGIVGLVGGTMLGLYITHADLASIRITGLQPRYFLAAILMAFMLLSILLGKAVRPRLLGESLALHRTEQFTLNISVAVSLFSAFMLFQSYFIGQWLPKLEGGWKLVNFMGWVAT